MLWQHLVVEGDNGILTITALRRTTAHKNWKEFKFVASLFQRKIYISFVADMSYPQPLSPIFLSYS
jgi:hypothetical protein